jgi:hypothetical protein
MSASEEHQAEFEHLCFDDSQVTDEDRKRAAALRPLVVGDGPWARAYREGGVSVVLLKRHVDAELAALRERLVRAEAVCEAVCEAVIAADREPVSGDRYAARDAEIAALAAYKAGKDHNAG